MRPLFLLGLVLALAPAGCGGPAGGPPDGGASSRSADGGGVALPAICPSGGCPHGSYCDLNSNRCVAGCLSDDDCPGDEVCRDRSCVTGCREDCSGGRVCVGSQCQCPQGTTECGGVCTDTSSDAQSCGACGNACAAPPNGTASCQSGQCVTACNDGYHVCNDACVTNSDTSACLCQCPIGCPLTGECVGPNCCLEDVLAGTCQASSTCMQSSS